MTTTHRISAIVLLLVLTRPAAAQAAGQAAGPDAALAPPFVPPSVPRLTEVRVVENDAAGRIEQLNLTVWENCETKVGRTLDLQVVVLRARSRTPEPDPVFIFDGGPGLAAAERWQRFVDHWMRRDRDVVLLSQRGTGGTNRLDCAAPGSADDVQSYLDPVFSDLDAFARCRDSLEEHADLRWYGTATAMADVDDLRRALGYGKINLSGGSYGSRAALEYVRRYGEHVRAAIVTGVAPVAFVNPLYHALAAQRAIELIFAECAGDPDCAKTYPDLRRMLAETLERLDREPARVTVLDAAAGRAVELTLTRDAFAEALRILMYYDSRRIPYLVQRAFEGDYQTFALAGLESNRMIRDAVAFGMLLCVTCGEDIPRIDPALIEELTSGTFLGDVRVRQQMAVCATWPASRVPDDHGEPLRSEVPILMLSGVYDPVTPPSFAEAAARHLPNVLHVVAPGSHGVAGWCIELVQRDFLSRGMTHGVNTSCVDAMDLGPFYVERGKEDE